MLDDRHSGGSGGRGVEATAVRAVGCVWTARASVGHLRTVGTAVQTPPLICCGERNTEDYILRGEQFIVLDKDSDHLSLLNV